MCFVGLAGWLSGRDKKIASDATWRGEVSTMLKNIDGSVSGITTRINVLDTCSREQGERLTALKAQQSRRTSE